MASRFKVEDLVNGGCRFAARLPVLATTIFKQKNSEILSFIICSETLCYMSCRRGVLFPGAVPCVGLYHGDKERTMGFRAAAFITGILPSCRFFIGAAAAKIPFHGDKFPKAEREAKLFRFLRACTEWQGTRCPT